MDKLVFETTIFINSDRNISDKVLYLDIIKNNSLIKPLNNIQIIDLTPYVSQDFKYGYKLAIVINSSDLKDLEKDTIYTIKYSLFEQNNLNKGYFGYFNFKIV